VQKAMELIAFKTDPGDEVVAGVLFNPGILPERGPSLRRKIGMTISFHNN
jgi:hypothetical protein